MIPLLLHSNLAFTLYHYHVDNQLVRPIKISRIRYLTNSIKAVKFHKYNKWLISLFKFNRLRNDTNSFDIDKELRDHRHFWRFKHKINGTSKVKGHQGHNLYFPRAAGCCGPVWNIRARTFAGEMEMWPFDCGWPWFDRKGNLRSTIIVKQRNRLWWLPITVL